MLNNYLCQRMSGIMLRIIGEINFLSNSQWPGQGGRGRQGSREPKTAQCGAGFPKCKCMGLAPVFSRVFHS